MKASRFLILLSIVVSLLVILLAGANIWRERAQALDEARERLTSLNLALAEQMERSLQAVDFGLSDILQVLDHAVAWESAETHNQLKGYVAALPQIRAIAIVNADGIIVADSALHPATPIYVGDREHFRFLKDNPRHGMYIAAPNVSRRDKEWTVVLSRAIVGRHGEFRGVVFARMQPKYFQDLYRGVLHLDGSAVTVFRRDATLLFRQPHVDTMVGKRLPDVPLFTTLLPQAERGTYEAPAVSDGKQRVFSYAALRAYPIVVNSHQTKDQILARWRDSVWITLLVIGLVLLAGFWLMRCLLCALRKQEEAAEALLLGASVFEHTQEGILITDAARRIIDVNRAFTRLTGYSLDDLRGQTPAALKSGSHDQAFYDAMWRSIDNTGEWRGEIWNFKKSGELYPGILNISAVKNAVGRTTHYVAVYADISDLKNTQQYLEKLANYDTLTGLPNRMLLADRLRQAIAHARRHERLLAVCFLDLDGFKPINDRHGHGVGDQLLVLVAGRLLQAVRAEDTVARLGGDEFVLLLSELNTVDECELALERIIEDLSASYAVGTLDLRLSASIGIAIYPFDDAEPDMLLRLADHAMYQAKQGGRNRYCFYEAENGGGKVNEAR
jgi:diguanylate cyclase (GGDEF)-like protein/PAS domain S-box-containing protein